MVDKLQIDSLLAKVFQESTEGIMITDSDGLIIKANPAFERDSGYAAAELVGENPSIMKSGVHGPEFYAEMWRSLAQDGRWQGEIWDRRKNGEIYAKWLSISAITDDMGAVTNYVGIHQDITRRKQTEAHLEHLAHYDTLTGLPNRVLFVERLRRAMAMATKNGQQVAVLFIDLDGFKNVNDSLGHRAGDRLLVAVGARFERSVREADTVARFGGDEFTVALPAINSSQAPQAVSNKLTEALKNPFVVDGHDIHISASIGIAMYPFDGADPDTLYKCADYAMYEAKKNGKGRYRFYSTRMQGKAMERFTIETELRRALERGDIVVYYQPQVDAVTHETVSVEALVRWNHPDRGLMLPGEFLPVAEESGLIVDLGRLVFKEACRQAAQWNERGAGIQVWVNLSAQQFLTGDLPMVIGEALQENDVDPSLLGIEVTEGTMMEDIDEAAAMLREITAMGVEVAIDDFGTGYSSLSYLASFPLSYLKIPYEFVSKMVENKGQRKIAESIIAMARELGLKVVAEGVEREDQRSLLEENGCDLIQGFLFSRAVPPEEICAMLDRCEEK